MSLREYEYEQSTLCRCVCCTLHVVLCSRSSKEKSNKDNIVVEMKSDTEEAVLLGVNGEKQPPSD